MATLFHWKIVLAFLSKLRFARDYAKCCLGRLALLFAFLGRKFSKWCHSRPGKPDTSKTLKTADPPFHDSDGNSYSVTGGPTIVKQYTIAGSSVPTSASLPSLHERVERQPATAATTVNARVGTLPAPAHDPVNRRSASIGSTQSRASDRFSVITTSHDSTRATHDQPSRLPRATHRQGPDPSRSRERPTRPSTPHDPPRPSPDIITTNLFSLDHEDGRVSPALQPSASSLASSPYTHRSLNLSPTDETRRKETRTSFVVDVQNPLTESLPMEPTTAHSSPDPPIVDQHDGPVPGTPTSSNAATLDYSVPEGRFVRLVNSEQLPRHKKGALMQVEPVGYTLMQGDSEPGDTSMQVEYTILSPLPHISLQTSRGDIL